MGNKGKTGDYAAVLVILDRSGSMSSIKHDIESGLRQMAKAQEKLPGKVTFDLVTFDNDIEYDFSMRSPRDAQFVVNPRGGTALYDAIVKGCQDFAKVLSNLKEQPRHVQVVVATDGMENASQFADALLVRDTITYRTSRYGWDFTFLGSDESAIAEAAALGFQGKKSMKFKSSATGVAGMTSSLSDYITATRSGIDAGYSDDNRAASAQ